MRAWPSRRSALTSVERVHRRAVVPAALQCLGLETLHASAARSGQRRGGLLRSCGRRQIHHRRGLRRRRERSNGQTTHSCSRSAPAMSMPSPSPTMWRCVLPRSHTSATRLQPVARVACLRRPRTSSRLFLIERSIPMPLIQPLDPTEALQAVLPHACAFSMTDQARRRLMVSSTSRWSIWSPSIDSRIRRHSRFCRMSPNLCADRSIGPKPVTAR